jgi:hypothetical protein
VTTTRCGVEDGGGLDRLATRLVVEDEQNTQMLFCGEWVAGGLIC